MSRWDASRPSRDPHRDESGSGPRQAGGAPPDIFEQEYGPQAYAQEPDGRADYSLPEYDQPEYGQPGRQGPAQEGYPGQDYGQWQHGQQDFGQQDYGRREPPGFGQLDREPPGFGQLDREPPGFGQLDREQPDYGQPDYGQPDWGQLEREQSRHGQQDRQLPGFGQLEREQPDYGQPDDREPGYAGRDYVGRDTVDPNYAARMDPALQDFFKPVPPGRDFSPSGPQPRQPRLPDQPDQPDQAGQASQAGQQRNGEPFPPTQSHRPFRPEPGQAPLGSLDDSATSWAARMDSAAQANGTDRWDTPAPAPRPGSRSARHQEDRQQPRRGHGRAIAAAIGVVVMIGIVAGAYKLLDKKSTPPAASSTPPAVAPSQHQPTPATSHATTSTNANSAGYTLSAPATAGGYSKLVRAPSAVSNVAAATAQGVREQAVNAGSKVTGQVTGYYQLSSGQVMSFTGYEGTFDPTKVLAAMGGKSFPAGPHGGGLICAPSTGTPGGTVCVWATTTTLGVTEFFGSTGAPEVVTDQAKAAQDTVNVRGDVEAAKS
jgi:hypothetical protein